MGEFVVHTVRFYKPMPFGINCLDVDRRNHKLALGRSNNSVEIWDIRGAFYCEKTIVGHPDRPVDALCWNEQRLFSTGFNGDLTEYDLETCTVKKSIQVTAGACWCMAQNHKNTQLVFGTEDGTIFLYNFTSEGAEYEKIIGRQEARILSVAWYHDNVTIVTGSMNFLTIWNTKTSTQLHRIDVGRPNRYNEAAIWCLAVSSDNTIASGDSCKRVLMWDGNMGILIGSFKPHRADVLTVTFNEDESSVHAAGIDPVISVYTRRKQRDWLKSVEIHQHINDVKAMALVGELVVSAGVDGYIRFCRGLSKFGVSIPPIQQHSNIHVAEQARSLLFQHPTELELWRMSAAKPEDMNPKPECLLKLQSNSSDYIYGSAISADLRWMVYTTANRLRVFQLTIISGEGNKKANVLADKIKFVPAECQITSCVTFTNDSSTLIAASPTGHIHFLTLKNREVTLLTSLTSEQSGFDSRISKMCVNPDNSLLAVTNHGGLVNVFDLAQKKLLYSLPRSKFQVTAMNFHPVTGDFVVAYSNLRIMEVDPKKGNFTEFGRKLDGPVIEGAITVITEITFDHDRPEIILLRAGDRFFILNKDEYLSGKVIEKSKQGPGIHTCHGYKHLAYVGALGTPGTLAVVEVHPDNIALKLPPALKIKKFGT